MFIACQHCHELIAIHPPALLAPERCPRCGGALQAPAGAATAVPAGTAPRSFATLLRGSEPAAEPAATPAIPAEEAKHSAQPASLAPSPSPASLATETADAGAAAAPVEDAPTAVASSAAAMAAEPTGAAAPIPPAEDPQPLLPADDRGGDPQAEPAAVAGAATAGNPADAVTASTSTAMSGASASGPSFTRGVRTTPVHSGSSRLQWGALAALSLLLAIQVLLADRARLAGDAGWRPLLLSICGVLRCSLPPWRQPEAFVMLSRDVRPLPGSAGVLQAQASFRNDARWPQPWPVLLLTLKDADGRTLGARALTPDEYLDAAVDGNEIAAGQSAQIAVRIREPSANVVAFSFDFR